LHFFTGNWNQLFYSRSSWGRWMAAIISVLILDRQLLHRKLNLRWNKANKAAATSGCRGCEKLISVTLYSVIKANLVIAFACSTFLVSSSEIGAKCNTQWRLNESTVIIYMKKKRGELSATKATFSSLFFLILIAARWREN